MKDKTDATSPPVKIYKLDDRMNFGKHKGKLILNLIDEAPDYLIWAHENVVFFNLELSVYKSLVEDKIAEDDGWLDEREFLDEDE